MQIDPTPLDVLVLLEDGVPARADLTIAVDVATRIGVAVLLLARMLVPEPSSWYQRA